LVRLARTRALMEIGWIAVHLCPLAPERIAPKRFADPLHFDVAAHVSTHAGLACARLARARALLPSLLSGVSGQTALPHHSRKTEVLGGT